MIYITQLIYIQTGQEELFLQFENVAMPLLEKYSGSLLLRIKPSKDSVISASVEVPYEIHFIRFESEKDFEAFKVNEERKKFLHLKEASVRSVLMVKGEAI